MNLRWAPVRGLTFGAIVLVALASASCIPAGDTSKAFKTIRIYDLLEATRDAIVKGNILIEPSPTGICLSNDNQGFVGAPQDIASPNGKMLRFDLSREAPDGRDARGGGEVSVTGVLYGG